MQNLRSFSSNMSRAFIWFRILRCWIFEHSEHALCLVGQKEPEVPRLVLKISLNSILFQSWVCAAKECFLTWSFLGGSLLQLSAHNKFRHNLRRDSTIIILITLIFLSVSGILGVAIHKLIETSGQYTYIPSSFGEHCFSCFLPKLQVILCYNEKLKPSPHLYQILSKHNFHH